MVSKRLKEWASPKGWTERDKRIGGQYRGYLFTAYDELGCKTFATFLPELEEPVVAELRGFLRENMAALKIQQFDVTGRILKVSLAEKYRSASFGEMDSLLDAITGYLSQKGIPGDQFCCHCGQPGPDQPVLVGGVLTTAHSACFHQMMDQANRSRFEDAYEPKNYLPGAAGSLIGGLVASVPWVVVQVYLERIASILGLLIGLGALKGYTLLKGKTGPATRWIVAASTILSVVIAQFVITVLSIRQQGLIIDFETFRVLLTIPEFQTAMLKDTGLSLFMALLGIAQLFTGIKKDIRNQTPEVVKVE